MMKKIAIFLVMIMVALSASAVLKERDLARTLDVLQAELEHAYTEQQAQLKLYEQYTKAQHKQLVETMQRIDQISIILYSQRADFTFDMAYACQQASDLYRNNRIQALPYKRIIAMLQSEIQRHDSLVVVLRNISPAIDNKLNDSITAVDSLIIDLKEKVPAKADLFTLNEHQQQQREKCLFFALAIRDNLAVLIDRIVEDQHYYDLVTTKLKSLNDYAMLRYDELRRSIFENGGQNYFTVLSQLPEAMEVSKMEVKDKYNNLTTKSDGRRVDSDWRGPVIIGTSVFVLFYIAVAWLVSFLILRFILPKRWRENLTYRSKRHMIGLACGVFLFLIAITIVKTFIYNNFIAMAIGFIISFAWLILAILVSLLIRLQGKQLYSTAAAYTPFLLMAFIVIVFRIVFIPTNVVNLIYPPILFVFTIWQYVVVKRRKGKLAESDMIFSVISLVVMVVGCVLAWLGYTLLAVEIMIWWSFQLAFIQSIICLYDLLRLYESRFILKSIKAVEAKKAEKAENAKQPKGHKAKNVKPESDEEKAKALLERAAKGEFITKTYVYDFLYKAALPVAALLSVLLSVDYAANMFDMREIFIKIFLYNFVDKPGMLQLSLYKVVLVGILFFLFRYLNYAIHAFYRHYMLSRNGNDVNFRGNFTLANNIITIATWGAYFIIALIMLHVPKSGISLITAGLATGLGFAMKDVLENFIYGLSLMSGRVRVGDYIECDGILGKVERITYQSTQIITLDGSVIAFLNTQLFNKNFKNLTRNHSYELVKVPIGVAYGTDVNVVRQTLLNDLNKLPIVKAGRPIIRKKSGFQVLFSGFGDNSVDLVVAFWVLVEEKIQFEATVKETIYNTLQRQKIEIPFPQRDVYIRQMTAPTPAPMPAINPEPEPEPQPKK